MSDHISKAEIRKDAVQNTVEAAAGTVGQVTTILVTAVGDVAKAIGGLGTDLFELRDAARKAAAQHDD
jgi:phage-related protein